MAAVQKNCKNRLPLKSLKFNAVKSKSQGFARRRDRGNELPFCRRGIHQIFPLDYCNAIFVIFIQTFRMTTILSTVFLKTATEWAIVWCYDCSCGDDSRL